MTKEYKEQIIKEFQNNVNAIVECKYIRNDYFEAISKLINSVHERSMESKHELYSIAREIVPSFKFSHLRLDIKDNCYPSKILCCEYKIGDTRQFLDEIIDETYNFFPLDGGGWGMSGFEYCQTIERVLKKENEYSFIGYHTAIIQFENDICIKICQNKDGGAWIRHDTSGPLNNSNKCSINLSNVEIVENWVNKNM